MGTSVLEVEREPPLVPIGQEVKDARVSDQRICPRPTSLPCTAVWVLHLDDVRPKISQVLYAGGSHQELGEAEDADALQGPGLS